MGLIPAGGLRTHHLSTAKTPETEISQSSQVNYNPESLPKRAELISPGCCFLITSPAKEELQDSFFQLELSSNKTWTLPRAGRWGLTWPHSRGWQEAVKHCVAPSLQTHLEHRPRCQSSPSWNKCPSKEQGSKRQENNG